MSNRKTPDTILTAYATKGKLAGLSVGATNQIALYNMRAWNNSGSSQNIGLMRLLAANPSSWRVWQYTAVGTVYTDVTAAVQAGTATNIFSGTNNDGFIVQSKRRIGLIGFTISTDGTGATVTYKYSNAATTFASWTTLEVPVYTSNTDVWIVGLPAPDMALGGNAALDQTKYSVQVISTTAPGNAVAITNMWVAEFMDFYEGVGNNSAVQLSFPDSKPFVLEGSQGLMPYFSSPNAANQFGAYFVAL